MNRSLRYEPPGNPLGELRPTPALQLLLIVTVVAYLVQMWLEHFFGPELYSWLGLNDRLFLRARIWQPVSYVFLHGGFGHLLFNMVALYLWGREVERVLGRERFLMLYFVSGALGGLGWLVFSRFMEILSVSTQGYCIGASGAVLGVVGAYAGLFPHQRLSLLFFPFITFTARALAIGFALVSLYIMMMPGRGEIAHAAHFFGLLAGYLYVRRTLTKRGSKDDRGGAAQSYGRVIDFPESGEKRTAAQKPTEAEVNRILEKISAEGMTSLSREERRILDQASSEN